MSDKKDGQPQLMGLMITCALVFVVHQNASRQAARVRLDKAHHVVAGIVPLARADTALGELGRSFVDEQWRSWPQSVPGKQRKSPVSEWATHQLVNAAIPALNRLRPAWPLFLLLALASPLLLWWHARREPASSWSTLSNIAHGTCALAGGVGLAAAIPAAWPAWLARAGLVYGGVNTLGGLGFLLSAVGSGTNGRKFIDGPKFRLPRTLAQKAAQGPDGIVVGTVSKDVLPEHVRWSAKLSAGKIVVPFDQISNGVTVFGERGSGKSRLLFGIHDEIRSRYPNIPILINDAKPEWYPTYYDKDTDLVFAPHFKGTSSWAFWKDFEKMPELRKTLLATAVYEYADPDDRFWMEQGAALLDSMSDQPSIDKAMLEVNKMRDKDPDDRFFQSRYGAAELGLTDIARIELAAAAATAENPARSMIDFLKWPGRIFMYNPGSCALEQKGAFNLFLTAFLTRAVSLPDRQKADDLQAVAIVDEALSFHIPARVEQQAYQTSRSKGLAIIAGAQRRPNQQKGERGEWDNAMFKFGMHLTDQDTQDWLGQKAGKITWEEQRRGRTSGEGRGDSTSEHEQVMTYDYFSPEQYQRMGRRQFMLFHHNALVTGKTTDVKREQRPMTLTYDPRNDVREFMKALQYKGADQAPQEIPS